MIGLGEHREGLRTETSATAPPTGNYYTISSARVKCQRRAFYRGNHVGSID